MNQYRNRVISKADLDYLEAHRKGMFRRAQSFGWRIATNELPADLTLRDFGILPQSAPQGPTLEEYVAHGYAPETYEQFKRGYVPPQAPSTELDSE